jgi:MraZ protein
MFVGTYKCSWDGGGIVIPREFRSGLALGAVMTRGIEHCLWLHPLPEWRSLAERLANLPLTRGDCRSLVRLLYAGAVQRELDDEGRLFVTDELRQYAHLGQEVILLGLGSHLEVWDAGLWGEAQGRVEEEAEALAERVGLMGEEI